MAKINGVLGEIDTADLGFTLMHEHILCAAWSMRQAFHDWVNLDAFIEETQERVSGEVKVKLYKGSCHVVGRSSPFSLYDKDLATYNIETTFDQSSSAGFIELWGLPTRVASALKKKMAAKQDV